MTIPPAANRQVPLVRRGPQSTPGGIQRLGAACEAHRDFLLLLALFAFLLIMLLIFFAPGGRFGDYSDYWYYEEMASRLDGGYLPYVHYWVEYPPLFPWLPLGAYWLSRLLPPAQDPHLWFYVVLGGLMGLFGVANLAMVYLLGLQIYDRPGALRCGWFYALLFGPIFVYAGYFDGVALFFMLASLYLLFKKRPFSSGLVAAVGAMIKVLPLALVPIGFKLLAGRWRYLVGLALVVVGVNLPFYLLNPAMFVASWRALLTQPSWETIWALLDGYYSYGLVLGNRFDPAQAGTGQRPERVPWSAVLALFGLVYLAAYLLPWQQHPADRPDRRERSWLKRALSQFRRPGADGDDAGVYHLGVVAFVGLSLNLFMIFSRGYSPQFLLWTLPFLVLALPNGWGLLYATLLTLDSVVERILYFFVLPDSHWLLTGTVLFRTVLMLLLVPEYLAVMGFVLPWRWARIRRWGLFALALTTLLVAGLGVGAFVRDYEQQRYSNSPQRQVIDRIRAQALPGDGVVVTGRAAFDGVAPFLPDQEVRLYTREDGEFRQAAFEKQWAGVLARRPRIWLILDYAGGQNADWNAHLTELLGQVGYQTADEWVGPEQRLVHYAILEPEVERAVKVDTVFGSGVRLMRVTLDGDPLRPGEVVRLALRWQIMDESGREYTAFIHLVSDQGQIVAQRDLSLAAGRRTARVGLLLPRDLAPGRYHLSLGVYDPATGERLPLSQHAGQNLSGRQESLDLGEVLVQ